MSESCKDLDFEATLRALSEAIAKAHPNEALALVGIHSGGVPIAKRLAAMLESNGLKDIALGSLDIGLYRDDTNLASGIPTLVGSEIEFDVSERSCILVDDVLFTGRTIRAAMNQLADYGRAKSIELAVLVDRGHRELPIAATYVGAKVETTRADHVRVLVAEIDGEDRISIEERSAKALT